MRKWAWGILVCMSVGCGDNGKPYGAPCTNNDECASSNCAGLDSLHICTCGSDDDCPAGETCRKTIDIGPRCFATGAGSGSN